MIQDKLTKYMQTDRYIEQCKRKSYNKERNIVEEVGNYIVKIVQLMNDKTQFPSCHCLFSKALQVNFDPTQFSVDL